MAIDLNHWLFHDEYYVDEAALLLAGIEPLRVEDSITKKRAAILDRLGEQKFYTNEDLGLPFGSCRLVSNARHDNVEGWEKATMYCGELFSSVNKHIVDPCFDTYNHRISKEDVYTWARSKGIKEFPMGCPIPETDQDISTQQSDNISPITKQTYLAVIGALATVLAELDESQTRPMKNKKIVRAGSISAKALADIVSKRFEGKRLPLKSSNRTISEALKLIEETKKACT